MGDRPPVLVRYRPERTYPTAQLNFPGAHAEPYKRGWWPRELQTNGACTDGNSNLCFLGGLLFIAGDYSTIGGTARANLAAVRYIDGTLADVAVTATLAGGGARIKALATDGTYLYVGGKFDAVQWTDRTTLVPGGTPTTSTSLAGRPISGLFRMDANGNLDTTWNPQPNTAADLSLIVYNPVVGTLFISGLLSTVNGIARVNVAEVTLTGAGTATTFNPNPNPGGIKNIRCDTAQAKVYFVGGFTAISGTPRNTLARYTVTAGVYALDTWNPAPNANAYDVAIEGITTWVCGAFTSIGVTPTGRTYLAQLRDDGEVMAFSVVINAPVTTLARYLDNVIIAGTFTQVSATVRNYMAAISVAGTLQTWNPGRSTTVTGMVVKDRTVYVNGGVGSITYYGVATSGYNSVAYPLFTNTNSRFISKLGNDGSAGTRAAPWLTYRAGVNAMNGGTCSYVVGLDSGTYSERLVNVFGGVPVSYAGPDTDGGIYANDGAAPTISQRYGTLAGTYGARRTGRSISSVGAFPGTFLFVSKLGSDATGLKGNQARPYLTITAAQAASIAGDTVRIDDSGTYIENLVFPGNRTLQAKDGEMPRVVGAHTINGSTSLYGVIFSGASTVTGFAMVGAGTYVSAWDCTFIGYTRTFYHTTGGLSEFVNCLFLRNTYQCIEWVFTVAVTPSAFTVRNCHFSQCGTFGRQVGSGNSEANILLTLSAGGTPAIGIDIDGNTFENCGGQYAVRIASTLAATGNSLIRRNYFLKNLTYNLGTLVAGYAPPTTGIGLQQVRQSGVYVTDNYAEGVGAGLYQDELTSSAPTVVQNFTIQNTTDGFVNASTHNGINHSGCAVINPSRYGWYGSFANTPCSDLLISNSVAVNAGLWGWYFAGGNGSNFVRISNSIEKGSGTGSVGGTYSGTVTLTVFVYESATATTGTLYVINADPQIVNSVGDTVNAALQMSSPAPQDYVEMGPSAPLIEVIAAPRPVTICGIILSGRVNTFSGIRVLSGLAKPVTLCYCTFTELGNVAAALYGSARVSNCLFNVSGSGVIATYSDIILEYCEAYGCGAGFAYVTANATIRNCTAYASPYGVFVTAPASPLLTNVVLSGNGAYDLLGYDAVPYSDIEQTNALTVTPTQKNPLFRDADVPDLRLQTVELGYLEDSPAKRIGNDGLDAGAFRYWYGPGVTTWVLLDFGKNEGDTPTAYRNPDHIEKTPRVLKLAEGDTFGKTLYSDALATKLEYVLSWDGDTNMPASQVLDLIDLFTAETNECQISFDDGGTWIPVRLVRSNEPLVTEIDGAFYSGDTLPTPLRSITFRESA